MDDALSEGAGMSRSGQDAAMALPLKSKLSAAYHVLPYTVCVALQLGCDKLWNCAACHVLRRTVCVALKFCCDKLCVWSWVLRTCGIACVEVQWFCFGNVFGNHNDPKVQFTFSNLFGNTFEDLDDFKMYLHFVWFRESIFGSQAL